MVDSVFVSRISENALNAVSLAFPLQNLMIAFGSGTAVGMNALLSRSLGAKQQEQVDRAANTGMFLFGCTYVLFALIGALLSRPFFLAQTHDAEIVGYGVDYASICLIFSFGIFAQFCFERLLQSTGRTKVSMMTQLIGCGHQHRARPDPDFRLVRPPAARGQRRRHRDRRRADHRGHHRPVRQPEEKSLKFTSARSSSAGTARRRAKFTAWACPSIIMGSIGSVMTFGMNKILIAFTTTADGGLRRVFQIAEFHLHAGLRSE